jgi:anti-anti-sigma factor
MEGSYTVLVMNLMLDARVEDDTAVVTCRGHIVYGATARRFRACIARLLQRYRRVVLDLGAVTHLDARGVGMLAVLIARARSTDRGLTLSTSSDRVERVLRLSGLDVELHNESRLRDRTARWAETTEDHRLPEQAAARTKGDLGDARNGWRGSNSNRGWDYDRVRRSRSLARRPSVAAIRPIVLNVDIDDSTRGSV